MNKRIKLLAKKAGINLTPAQFSGVLEDEVDEFTLEKFAELIVRECTLQIADVRIEHDFDPAVDEVLVQALTGIKKHFGVEE